MQRCLLLILSPVTVITFTQLGLETWDLVGAVEAAGPWKSSGEGVCRWTLIKVVSTLLKTYCVPSTVLLESWGCLWRQWLAEAVHHEQIHARQCSACRKQSLLA